MNEIGKGLGDPPKKILRSWSIDFLSGTDKRKLGQHNKIKWVWALHVKNIVNY